MNHKGNSASCFARSLPAASVWSVELLLIAIACGAAFGWLAAVVNSGKLTIMIILLLGVPTGILAAFTAKGMRIGQTPLICLGGLVAGSLTAYAYLVVRIGYLYDWQIVPWSPHHLYYLWPDVDGDWVQVDQYSGKTSAAGFERIVMMQLGFVSAFISATLCSALAAWLTRKSFPPFCYRCRRWIKDPVDTFVFDPAKLTLAAGNSLKKGNPAFLDRLTPIQPQTGEYERTEIRVFQCGSCDSEAVMNAHRYIFVDNNGRPNLSDERMFHDVPVSDELLVRLHARRDAMPADQGEASPTDAADPSDSPATPGSGPFAGDIMGRG